MERHQQPSDFYGDLIGDLVGDLIGDFYGLVTRDNIGLAASGGHEPVGQ
jgi:hypothetical protein